MTEIKPYIQGQPIEDVEETRVYIHKDVLRYLELYQEIGTISQLRALKEERDKYFLEIQQYRAIGAVGDIEKGIKQSEEEFNMLMEYRNIGTIEECKALKEKSVAKKPEYAPTDDSCLYSEYVCPNCYIRLPNFRQKYCQCGQKLDC